MKKLIVVLLFCMTLPVFGQTFTLAVIPDTQNYTDAFMQGWLLHPVRNQDILYRQMQYIVDNSEKNGGDIVFAVHLGDQVNNVSWFKSEWRRADKAMSMLDGNVPWLGVPGNHDYDHWSGFGFKWEKIRYIKGLKNYCHYFGAESKHFKNAPWYGGSYNGGASSWGTFTQEGQQFLILALEYQPAVDCIAWAQTVLDEHPGIPVILVTHEYLTTRYENKELKIPAYAKSRTQRKDGIKPAQMWTDFISKNSRIFMVLCGHSFSAGEGERFRVDINEAGYPVYAILSDYQGRSECSPHCYPSDCGDGWMRLLHFDLTEGLIQVRTYSTELKRYETDEDSQFDIVFDWDWNERFLGE